MVQNDGLGLNFLKLEKKSDFFSGVSKKSVYIWSYIYKKYNSKISYFEGYLPNKLVVAGSKKSGIFFPQKNPFDMLEKRYDTIFC